MATHVAKGLWLLLALPSILSGALAQHVALTLGVETEVYEVPCNQYKYFTVEAIEPCEDLRVRVNHVAGEPDLYISRGPQETPVFTSLAWSSYAWGSESLTISSWDPEYQLGTYYIGVLSYCGSDVGTGSTPAQFSVIAEHIQSAHPHDELPIDGSVAGNIKADGYQYYRFCLPSSCVNVNVGLTNCLDPSTCPTSYSYPELLVSRSIQQPTINSHAWKLASIEVRSVTLQHDDPDFYPGHYFVGVYGWCTPDPLCSNFTTCGPCSYANNTEYALSLNVEEVTEGCTPKPPLELCTGAAVTMAPLSITVLLTLFFLIAAFVSDEISAFLCYFAKPPVFIPPVQRSITMSRRAVDIHIALVALLMLANVINGEGEGEHIELTLGTTSAEHSVPCEEYLYFKVEATQMTPVQGEADIYVSKAPEEFPTSNSLGWISYEWGVEALTINSWDPEYQIGSYYIGIYGYCSNDTGVDVAPVRVTVLAEHVNSNPPHDFLTVGGSVSGRVDAMGYSYHSFCLPSRCVQLRLTLENCDDPDECPNSYAFPDLIVSRTEQSPIIHSYSWKLAESEGKTIVLDPDVDSFCAGYYFVAVYGYCVPDNLCINKASCGPCSYAGNHSYTVSLETMATTAVETCDEDMPCKGVRYLSSMLLLMAAGLSALFFELI
ncbi:uncharacterized protein [Diadema setosum]|uniref:uncharacterized protein n=1 Tax=Diadema setosum TaxID=31175 RepID=UPI003B3B782F